MLDILNTFNSLQKAPNSRAKLKTNKTLKEQLKKFIVHGAGDFPVLLKLEQENGRVPEFYLAKSYERDVLAIVPLKQAVKESDIDRLTNNELFVQMKKAIGYEPIFIRESNGQSKVYVPFQYHIKPVIFLPLTIQEVELVFWGLSLDL